MHSKKEKTTTNKVNWTYKIEAQLQVLISAIVDKSVLRSQTFDIKGGGTWEQPHLTEGVP